MNQIRQTANLADNDHHENEIKESGAVDPHKPTHLQVPYAWINVKENENRKALHLSRVLFIPHSAKRLMLMTFVWVGIMLTCCLYTSWESDSYDPAKWWVFLIPIVFQLTCTMFWRMRYSMDMEEFDIAKKLFLAKYMLCLLLATTACFTAMQYEVDPVKVMQNDQLVKSDWKGVVQLMKNDSWNAPHVLVSLNGKSPIYLDELISLRKRNKALSNSIFTALVFMTINFCALFASSAVSIHEDYLFKCLAKLNDTGIPVELNFPALWKHVHCLAEQKVQWTWTHILLLSMASIVTSIAYAGIVEVLPKTSIGQVAELTYLELYQNNSNQGPFFTWLMHADAIDMALVLWQAVVLESICWVLLYAGCYFKSRVPLEQLILYEEMIVSPFEPDIQPLVFLNLSIVCGEYLRQHWKLNVLEWLKFRATLHAFILEPICRKLQLGVLALFLICMVLLTYLVMSFLLTRTFGFGVWGPWTVVTSPLTGLGTMRLLNFLLKAHHLRMSQLNQVALFIHLTQMQHHSQDRGMGDENEKQKMENVLHVTEELSKMVKPYTLVGMPVTTASFRTVAGYFVSCIVVILSFTIDLLI